MWPINYLVLCDGASGFSGMERWTGMVEWNVDKLDGFNGLSPPYNDHLWTRPPLNKDHPNLIVG